MKKKYVKQRPKRRYARRSSPAIVRIRWVFLGVLLTVIVGVIYFSGSKNKPSPHSVQKRHAPIVAHPKQQDHPSPKKSEYDFYTMLPKMQVDAKPQATEKSAARVENYVLQIASFKSFAEADRMRAQLLLMGFSASIQKYVVDEQLGYRIIIGPYPTRQAAIEQQRRLRGNSISSELVLKSS